MQKWRCNKIFLATEDKNFVQPFKEIFGDACVMIEREYIDYDSAPKTNIPKLHTARENDYFLRTKEYITELAILSKCNSFIAASCNGTISVMMMAENFENTYFFNLGKYGVVSLDGFMDDD